MAPEHFKAMSCSHKLPPTVILKPSQCLCEVMINENSGSGHSGYEFCMRVKCQKQRESDMPSVLGLCMLLTPSSFNPERNRAPNLLLHFYSWSL